MSAPPRTAAPTGPAAGTSAPADGSGLHRLAVAVYGVVLVVCSVVALGWLAVGAYVAIAWYVPGFGAGDSAWARAVAAAAPATEPMDQLVVDYALSLGAVAIAVVLLVRGGPSWPIRLLALAMVGSGGAFNLQAHAAATAVDTATGIAAGPIHQIVLHGVACAAYVLALLVFPTPQGAWPARWGRPGRVTLAVLGVLVLGLVGFGTALLRHTTSCVLFFGFLVPLVGVAVLPGRIRRGETAALRTQARLVFSLLVAAFAAIVVLGISTVVLWLLGVPGLELYDPTAHDSMTSGAAGQPVALLFWASRVGSAAIAVAVLVAVRAERLWSAEARFSRVLAAVLAVAVVGGGVIVFEAAGWLIGFGPLWSSLGASLLAAVAFLPVYRSVEGLTDRLLYGRRPTPYSALAEVAALSRTAASDAPDLARVAEAVGRALGSSRCRLTVVRPGLRDRTYEWASRRATRRDDGTGLVGVPVRGGEQHLGTLEVDRAAVAGLHADRRHLLEDIADSLGVVVTASRLGVELERQLRAALAHAAEIAVSRREAVSEMDAERRRIERDLHDGAQHQLVSLRLVLGLVQHEVENGRVEQARERLGVLAGQLDTAESVLAETASGVRSIALAERGLVAALEAELAGPPPVRVESSLAAGRRYPPELEGAVYFCCLESVNNAHKHAPGADVVIRFAEEDGRLHFTVRDSGPGFVVPEPAVVGPGAATAGRGLRNVAARIVAAGGRVDLRSAPGEGTTVEGSVPVPEAEVPAGGPPSAASIDAGPDGEADTTALDVAGLVVETRPAPAAASEHPDRDTDTTLPGQVRRALAAAAELGDAGLRERLRALEADLDRPLRVAVSGPPGSGVSTLVAALDATPGEVDLEIVEGTEGDVPLLVLPAVGGTAPGGTAPGGAPSDGTPPGGAPAIGVLARADELGTDPWGEARRLAAEPAVRRRCHTVVPVAAGLTRGRTGSALVAELAADGARPDEVAAELTRRSGVPRLRQLIERGLADRADALRARAVLRELDEIAVAHHAHDDGDLRYQLERLRSTAHELAELDLVDALRAGNPALSTDERAAAELLLGAEGTAAHRRLGLPADAGPEEIRLAAAAQLGRWQRRAEHPVSTRDQRAAAAVLVRTCERMLAETPVPAAVAPAGAAPSPTPPAGVGAGR
ncbi:histidine kinase [Pseudonocardia kujensis]|uniref:ATP-binding protein n=1 Tax=Pseudonocardia kujensis TaxID=1128675 RepID=UPI001E4450C0|nr:ATP-binding protein [Pseudonocardia kujensis]MCE0766803.1 histidine kinase [Pseudonocardia kujensis]